MKKMLFTCMLIGGLLHSPAQTKVINELVMQEVQTLIMERQCDKADSILDIYREYPQSSEGEFMLNYTRFMNGYAKLQTTHNISDIVPYADSGKKAFIYLKTNINLSNANESNCWPTLAMFAEIYNTLSDSIIIDISKFAYHYYKELHQEDLYSYFTVSLNSFQYSFSHKKWSYGIEIMRNYYDLSTEARDSTIRKPMSAAFIGAAYLWAKMSQEAEKWLVASYNLFQNYNERNVSRAYCELLSDMAYLYHLQGNNSLGYKFAKESCDANKANFGEYSSEYINALGLLSNCEMGLDKQKEGLSHLEQVVELLNRIPNMSEVEKQNYRDKLEIAYLRLNIKKDISSSDSILTENSIMLEATNSFSQGQIGDAISKLKFLWDYYNDNFQAVDIGNYVYVTGSLASAFVHNGNYTEADNMLNYSIETLQKNNVSSIQIRHLYEAKGLLYYTINNVDMAIQWYNQAKGLYEESEHKGFRYGILLSNLSACLMSKGNYSLAKELSDEAYDIVVHFYGDNSKDANDRLLLLNNLATIYVKLKDLEKAKELYQQVIADATSLQNGRTKALAIMNLAEIYLMFDNNLEKAEETLLEAANIDADLYVKDMIELDLLFVQCMLKRDETVSGIQRYNQNTKDKLIELFEHFSEVEREEFWTQKSQSLVILNNLLAITFNTQKSNEMAYDNAIFTKSMLINSGRLLGNLAKRNDKEIKDVYDSMLFLKKKLTDKRVSQDSIDYYRQNITQMEKWIVTSIPDFGEQLKAQFKTYKDVKEMLSEKDVAIEFVHLPQIKTPFEESELMLGALILTKEYSAPKLIPLCSEFELEDLLDVENSTSQNYIDSLYHISNTSLYHLLWENISSYIPNGSTVFFSPTGYINKVNLSAISDGKRRLAEIYDFHEVSTTASIYQVKKEIINSYNSAVLYGDINYYEDLDMMAIYSKKYTSFSSGSMMATRSGNRSTWDLIPGTKAEIEAINDLLKDQDISVQMFSQNDANEESFKALDSNSPEIIHIATHAFYFSPETEVTSSFFNGLSGNTQEDYSMFYSGLLFAGANNVWTGKEMKEDIEDGILTAGEIANLELSNNKLTVLSACNTGLGDIDNVNGVYGLQRGFKRAGANTILMSLWKVPDEETKVLMTAFYKELMSGHTPTQSLRMAQEQMISLGKSPYYWAGFVMLD